jgi:hypothetical protein
MAQNYRYLLLFLLITVTKIAAQSCYSSDCKTCLSSSNCYYFVKCSSCTSYSSGTCDGEYPISSYSSCPNPSWPTTTQLAASRSSVYGTLGLSALALVITAVLAYSPIEEICGLKVSPNFNGFNCSNHILFFGSFFLWIAVALSLAAPSLPWITSFSPSGSYSQQQVIFISALVIEACIIDSSTYEITGCPTTYKFSEVLSSLSSASSKNSAGSTELSYIQNALLLGTFGYVVTISLLFPCAVMTSIALYRYNRFVKYGIPAYTAGCSPASLSVAQMIGWPSFAIFVIVIGCGVQLASTATKFLRSSYSFGAFSDSQYLAMPGSVAGGISIFMQLLGLILVSIAAKALQNVKGVGCNSGGCCKLAVVDDDEEEEDQAPKRNKVAYERSSLLRS